MSNQTESQLAHHLRRNRIRRLNRRITDSKLGIQSVTLQENLTEDYKRARIGDFAGTIHRCRARLEELTGKTTSNQ